MALGLFSFSRELLDAQQNTDEEAKRLIEKYHTRYPENQKITSLVGSVGILGAALLVGEALSFSFPVLAPGVFTLILFAAALLCAFPFAVYCARRSDDITPIERELSQRVLSTFWPKPDNESIESADQLGHELVNQQPQQAG